VLGAIAGEMQAVSPVIADAGAPRAGEAPAVHGEPRDEIVKALGGAENVVSFEVFGKRVRVELIDESLIDGAALVNLNLRHREKLGRYHHILLA
jgi:hypothetical protein